MPHAPLFLFLTARQWFVTIAIGVTAAAICWPWYGFISLWIGCAILLTAIALIHLHYAGQYIVPLPHVALLVAALQYIFAAWFALYHPHDNPVYFIGDRLPLYYSYAGPVLLALTIGFGVSLWRIRLPFARTEKVEPDGTLLVELDVIGLLGILSLILGNLIKVSSLAFLFVLLSNLRFVSVYGRMVLGGAGWRWRLALVLCLEVLFATASAMFHNLLLWLLWTFALWVYCFRPKIWMTLGSIAAAVLLLPALQEAKWHLRSEAVDPIEGLPIELADTSVFDRTLRWVSFLAPSLQQTLLFQMEEEFISEMAVRYNQGWIINRVMLYTPDFEPYARGKTLVSAAEASLLPRLVAMNKAQSGGHENMEKFTGMVLTENTSMNLGFAGEMYANFGETGGIIGCGFYALFFGLLFRAFCHRAFSHPLWWSLVPFVFYAAVKAEEDIAFVLNWTVKGSVVLAVVVLFLPNFRHALFGRRPSGTDSRTKNREPMPALRASH